MTNFKNTLVSGVALLIASTAANAQTDLYSGFTLIDPATETVQANAWLTVEGGRILETGQGEPPAVDGARHRLSDQFLLPGFFDAHGHITAGPHAVQVVDGAPAITMESVDEITAFHARMALAFGVTTLRNPGGDPAASAAYDVRIASGEWLGPEALHAGAVIQPPPFVGNAFAYPQTPEEWDAEAARQAALGMRYFKLYHGLTEAELAMGIEAAHRHGLEAIAHLDHISWTRAIELGIDGLLHALPTSPALLEPEARATYLAQRGPNSKFMYQWFELVDFDGPLMQELITLMADRQVSVDMTLLVNAFTSEPDMSAVFTEETRRYTHPDSVDASQMMLGLSAIGWTQDDYARAEAAETRLFELVRRLHDAGVPLLLGTDGPGGGPLYADELALHIEAGLSPWSVLRLATSDAADILGLGETTGRIAPGLEADFVVLSANPLDDIMAVKSVELVVSNGHAHRFEDLTDVEPVRVSSAQ